MSAVRYIGLPVLELLPFITQPRVSKKPDLFTRAQ
jgi:hypothetical protein